MRTQNDGSRADAGYSSLPDNVLVRVDDFHHPNGWDDPAQAARRSRECCEQLEAGHILLFDRAPFSFPARDQEFLMSQRQSGSRLHKNAAYRPHENKVTGVSGSRREVRRVRVLMRTFSSEVTRFLGCLLPAYSVDMSVDYCSFRPEQEKDRNLPTHKRNDLLHVDAFPTRPSQGRRILRCFVNINPSESRVWHTTDGFATLSAQFAAAAGLSRIAAQGSHKTHPLIRELKSYFGLRTVDHSAYDRFMLRFHDYLKENAEFQQQCPKIRLEFPPGSAWLCFTDAVPHAVLSGQYAIEQTFFVPLRVLLHPERSPVRLLEKIAGVSLTRSNI